MTRPLRIQYPGAVYHVTARGNERKPIVRNDKDRWLFIRTLSETVDSFDVLVHSWVLMDNHYHLLIETPLANLSKALHHLNGVYTMRFNRRYRRFGHLFQGRYKSILVQKDNYLKELSRYLVLNPVRAGMVKHPKEWKWSSYRAMGGYEQEPEWLETNWLLGQFHKLKTKAQGLYREFVADGLKVKESPWEKLSSQIVLGANEFEQQIREKVGGICHFEAPQAQRKLALREPDEILEKICDMFGITMRDIVVPVRRENIGREVAIWALREECRLGLSEIARIMDVKYSAVSHAVSRAKRRIRETKGYEQKIRNAVFKT